ncbi:hypothetical protein E3N88_37621 [Mikania micrantha]|uniref:Uncharacterized protein n=1 Tax=Mikania micrantha TaxID=192012 RepID=A0A5N6LRM4_9ASTR|nr:hypothetical protein E3N88_37621 [Mikania micrantha]
MCSSSGQMFLESMTSRNPNPRSPISYDKINANAMNHGRSFATKEVQVDRVTASLDNSNGESKLVVLCLPFMNLVAWYTADEKKASYTSIKELAEGPYPEDNNPEDA